MDVPWPSLKTLYLRTGISVGKLSAFASGNGVPTVVQLRDALAASTSLSESDLKELVAAAPHHDSWRVNLSSTPKASLVIDKLAVSFTVDDQARYRHIAREGAFPARGPRFFNTTKATSHRATRHLLRVSIAFGVTARPWTRVVLSPALLFDSEADPRLAGVDVAALRRKVRRLLRLATSEVRVTRLDVAVDVTAPVALLQAYLADAKTRERFPRRGGPIETLYSGAETSHRYLCTYDKTLQLRRHRIFRTSPLTRMEMRLRFEGEHVLDLLSLGRLENPFQRAVVHVLQPPRAAPVGLKLLVRSMRDSGVDFVIRRLSIREQASLLETTRISNALGFHPASVFDAEWPSVASRLLRRLRVLGS